MKLSRLVDYRNQLDQMDLDPACGDATRHLDSIAHVITNHRLQIDDRAAVLETNLTEIKESIQRFQDTIADLRSRVQSQITEREPAYFQESLRMHEEEMCFDTTEYILNRRLGIDDESNILLRTRLRSYGDWRLPGMIIRPANETFIEDMVPLDPLYLVDHNQELLEPSMSKFTAEYRRRLRPYIISDWHMHKILPELPDNQFGLVFAYNYFNYKPLELIKRYLDEILEKLRPGGVFIMTYNNCDRAHAVALVENKFMCYTPGRHIKEYAESIGFEIAYNHVGAGDLTWIELRKPGEITSLRGGQTLGKIMPI